MTIEEAKEFAKQAHEGQIRYDGKPYHIHPFEVADAISKMTNNKNLIKAAILHDTIEDTKVTYEEIKERFGKATADYVLEVTHDKNGNYPNLNSEEGFALKCVDRAHNFLRLKTIPDEYKDEREKMTNRYKTTTKF